MKVSLLNLNLVARDAVGRDLIDKTRFFRDRGDQVRVYVQHVENDVPAEVRDLCVVCSLAQLTGRGAELAAPREHFRTSDLYVYDYPIWYELAESIRGVDRGVVIVDYHGVTPLDLWGSDEARDILQRSVDELPDLLRYADYAIGHSEFTRQELVERYGFAADKTFAFPYAVPLESFAPGAKDPALVRRYGLEGKRVLLYVGRMAGNKRIDLLVQALPLIQREFPETVLLLVGDNTSTAFAPVIAGINQQIQELGLSRDVIFTGRVDNLPDHYRLADIYVTSSLHEGFCVPLIEAMASGVPIVGSACTAIPGTLGEAGLTFEPENVRDLADKVIELLRDRDARERLRQLGLQRAAGFSRHEFRQRWQEVLQVVMAHQPELALATPVAFVEPATNGAAESAPGSAPLLPDLEEHYRELETMGDISMRDYVVRSDKPLIGPLLAWVRRNLTSHLKEPYVDPIIDRQVHVNRRLVWDIKMVYARLRDVAGYVERRLNELAEMVRLSDQRLQAEQARITALEARVAQLTAELAAAKTQTSGERMQYELQARQEMLAEQLANLQRLLEENPDLIRRDVAAVRAALQALSPEAWDRLGALQAALGLPGQLGAGFNYFVHADAMGGGVREMLREIYRPLVSKFHDAPEVVDLGCGKGAFLELLQEAGIPAYGVDLDEDSALYCRKRGLDVRHEDVMVHLASLPDKSVGGIFAAHLIEHLPRPVFWEFLRLCYQKLIYGGPLVLVTPNAAALSIFCFSFYKDLTHEQPLHPEAVVFALTMHGFRRVETSTISPLPDVLKLASLDLTLAADEAQRQWMAAINRNIARLNETVFGDLDCVVSAVK